MKKRRCLKTNEAAPFTFPEKELKRAPKSPKSVLKCGYPHSFVEKQEFEHASARSEIILNRFLCFMLILKSEIATDLTDHLVFGSEVYSDRMPLQAKGILSAHSRCPASGIS